LWEPDDILSIVGRGHEGRPLFASEDDRRFVVARLARTFVPDDVERRTARLGRAHQP